MTDSNYGNLVMSRFAGQGMHIGRDVRVTVAEVLSKYVKFVVECPKSVMVSWPWEAGEDEQHLLAQIEMERRGGTKVLTHTVSRQPGQSILIGRGVRVTLAEIHGPRARVCVQAPKHIAVNRDDFSRDQHLQKQARLDRQI